MEKNRFGKEGKPRVAFCCPTVTKPYPQFLAALEASLPLIEDAGWEHSAVYEVGNPYISAARSLMLRKALDWRADVVVFLDHDLSWAPEDLLLLIETEPDVVGGTYRFKRDEVEYMGTCMADKDGRPIFENHGEGELNSHLLWMANIPAGFLKVTTNAVNKFMIAYPELCYGDRFMPLVDLFNHGAHDWTWYGEDYAFCRRYSEKCGKVYCMPNLEIDHWLGTGECFKGNFHEFLMGCPQPD